jgi:hypothetical protein
MRTRQLSQFYARSAVSAPQSIDLMNDFTLENSIIVAMQLIIRGNMVSTGGGAISGFHRDAPCGVIQTAKCWGNIAGGVAKNQRTIFDMPPQQMFYPGSFFMNVFNALLRTSSGAAATDPFRATIPVPLVNPLSPIKDRTFIDCRDYTSFKLDLRWAAAADLATTNFSSDASVELEVQLTVMEDAPPRGIPHFEPELVYKELPADTASSRLTRDGDISWNGYLTALWLQQHDDSAAGDSERVDGLVRAFSVEHGKGQLVPFTRWDPTRRDTWSKFPYTQSTTEVTGVAALHLPMPPHSRRGKLNMIRNTSEANPLGVTAITPAAGDALFMTAISAEPVYGAKMMGRD